MILGMAGMAEKALPAPAGPARSRVDVADRARRFAMLFAFSLLVVDAAWPADVFARHGTAVHERHQKKRHETGFASFYGREWANHRTANGERFDPSELTAAHRTLPFGTRVKVTNLDNGRHVVVRINDRGPYAKGRVLDLSRAAARKLGFLDAGVARVRLEVLKDRRGERERMARADETTPTARPARGGGSIAPGASRSSRSSGTPAGSRSATTRKPSPGRA